MHVIRLKKFFLVLVSHEFKTVLLRYNLHTTKFNYCKYTFQ